MHPIFLLGAGGGILYMGCRDFLVMVEVVTLKQGSRQRVFNMED